MTMRVTVKLPADPQFHAGTLDRDSGFWFWKRPNGGSVSYDEMSTLRYVTEDIAGWYRVAISDVELRNIE